MIMSKNNNKIITDTIKDIEIQINDDSSMSIKKIRNPEMLEQLAKCVKSIANDKLVNDNKINNYTFKIYDLLVKYESNKLKTSSTNKQQLTYLRKIDNELKKLHSLINNAPEEIINTIDSIQDPLEIISDYSHSASSKEISEFFFNTTVIEKARMLVGIAIGKNKHHTNIMYEYEEDSNTFRKIENNQRGKKDNDVLSSLSNKLLKIFTELTDEKPTRIYNAYDGVEKSQSTDFLKEIFKVAKIKASPENQVKEYIKSHK
jgi:hypothetical protein